MISNKRNRRQGDEHGAVSICALKCNFLRKDAEVSAQNQNYQSEREIWRKSLGEGGETVFTKTQIGADLFYDDG